MQQQLAKHQMLVEAEQDKHTVASQLRMQKDATVAQVREVYHSLVQHLKEERRQGKKQLTIVLWVGLD